MNKNFANFFVKFSIYAFIIFVAGIILFSTLLSDFYYPFHVLSFFLFYTVTLLFHYFVLKAGQEKSAKFINYYMIATMFKIFIYLVYLSIFLFFHKQHARPFLITFLVLYFLFTFFEIRMLLLQFKKK